jgi:superfamily II RNA helicase
MSDTEGDEFDFSSDAEDALLDLVQEEASQKTIQNESQETIKQEFKDNGEEDAFDLSDGDDEAFLQLASQTTPAGLKRKHHDDPNESASSFSLAKRVKVYPEVSHIARKVLKQTFGLEAFRLKQEQAIARLLDGGSAAVVFPTGGGKSLCYQVRRQQFRANQINSNLSDSGHSIRRTGCVS